MPDNSLPSDGQDPQNVVITCAGGVQLPAIGTADGPANDQE